jgi:hypothetical protein
MEWIRVPAETLREENPGGLFDSSNVESRNRIDLGDFDLLDEDGAEVPIYDEEGAHVARREIVEDENLPPCGVLVDLEHIQALFNPGEGYETGSEDGESPPPLEDESVNIEAYPLAFLRTVGNIQAAGIPHCFYRKLKEISQKVRGPVTRGARNEDLEDEEENESNGGGTEVEMEVDDRASTQAVVRPVASQFYNYSAHRVSSRAGGHDSQQGTVTAVVAGAFAIGSKDKDKASKKREHCERGLPSTRFHERIMRNECPTSCRAELVYSIDVRAMKDPSGS